MASSIANDDTTTNPDLTNIQTTCELTFHGAAANSCPHSLLWVRAPSSRAASSHWNNDDTPNTKQENDLVENNEDVEEDTIIYASSGVINLATSYNYLSNNITSVNSTLVTRTLDNNVEGTNNNEKKVLARGEAAEDAAAPRSVTALSWVVANDDDYNSDNNEKKDVFGIVASFSDGTVTSWRYNSSNNNNSNNNANIIWGEHVIVGNDPQSTTTTTTTNTATTAADASRIYIHNYQEGLNTNKLLESISDITSVNLDYNTWLICTSSSQGIYLHVSYVVDTTDEQIDMVYTHEMGCHAASSVVLQKQKQQPRQTTNDSESSSSDNNNDNCCCCYLFAGSASPRHNKVWVYTIPYTTNSNVKSWVNLPLLSIGEPRYHGCLLGHQDWITCFSWLNDFDVTNNENEQHVGGGGEGRKESLLASSGHDAKIRLWKFTSYTNSSSSSSSSALKDDIVPELLKSEGEEEDSSSEVDENSDDDEANIDDLEEEEGEARLIINHHSAESASTTTVTTAVSLEALLLGHEEAVTSLTWRHQSKASRDKPCLLSSSMDRTILLWMEESNDGDAAVAATGVAASGGVWVPISRVGSAGGILGGSIGASLMGFVDAKFSPDAKRIVGHGYGGSIHFWTQVQSTNATVETIEEETTDDPEAEESFRTAVEEESHMEQVPVGDGKEPANADGDTDKPSVEVDEANIMEYGEEEEEDVLVSARWVADPCITGHFRSVEDMAWDPNGEYLLTTSSDQTTRLWTEVPVSNDPDQCRWVEVGRPQVHGYDMTSIVCIGGQDNSTNDGEPCHRFVSGADEKVLRVFDAPSSTLRVLHSIKQLRGAITQGGTQQPSNEEPGNDSLWRVERAFMPSLGLSNKATADADQESSKFAGPVNDDDLVQTLDTVNERPTSFEYPNVERDLAVTTLWPEARKLFGHESELVCLTSYRAPQGKDEPSLVASSCKARNDVESAAIRLWDAKNGKCVGILKGGHRSTVSTMSFSVDGKYLVSSGKDRRICVWKKVNDQSGCAEEGAIYELSAAADSAHKRIIWSVHFCPKRPNTLASGSRDGVIKLWCVNEVDDGSLDMNELCRFEPLSKAGKNPITAVAFAEDIIEGENKDQCDYGILSIGTESGRIEVWAVPISSNDEGATPKLLCVVPSNESHFDTVKKVSWRPVRSSEGDSNKGLINLTLASCGQDNGVRIFKLAIVRGNHPEEPIQALIGEGTPEGIEQIAEATTEEENGQSNNEQMVAEKASSESPIDKEVVVNSSTDENNNGVQTPETTKESTDREETLDKAPQSQPKPESKKLICLVSNGCHDRIQSSKQALTLNWFAARKVPYNVVDGMDPEQREMRNKLFGISGIRGNYPQFFFELQDGTVTFFGNFEKIEELNETNSLSDELLAQHPQFETWDRVFSSIVDSFD